MKAILKKISELHCQNFYPSKTFAYSSMQELFSSSTLNTLNFQIDSPIQKHFALQELLCFLNSKHFKLFSLERFKFGILTRQTSSMSMDEEDNHGYQTLFEDHLEGIEVSISRHTLLQMRIEKE